VKKGTSSRFIAAGDVLPEPRVTMIDPEIIVRESTAGE
jgi:hypothetical protein